MQDIFFELVGVSGTAKPDYTVDDGNDTTETKLLSVINAPQCH